MIKSVTYCHFTFNFPTPCCFNIPLISLSYITPPPRQKDDKRIPDFQVVPVFPKEQIPILIKYKCLQAIEDNFI